MPMASSSLANPVREQILRGDADARGPRPTCSGPFPIGAAEDELLHKRVDTDTALLDKGVVGTVNRRDLHTSVAPLTSLWQIAQCARAGKCYVTVL